MSEKQSNQINLNQSRCSGQGLSFSIKSNALSNKDTLFFYKNTLHKNIEAQIM